MLIVIIGKIYAIEFPKTLRIEKTIRTIESRGFTRTQYDSGQIQITIGIKISDTLPEFTTGAGYIFDTTYTTDTISIKTDYLREKYASENSSMEGGSIRGHFCSKDGMAAGKNGKFYGYGVYDTFELTPIKSNYIHFALQGKIVPWGFKKQYKFKKYILANRDTTISERGRSGTIVRYTIKFNEEK